jgi:hypothetical protein
VNNFGPCYTIAMPERTFPTIETLIREVEAQAASRPELPSLLAAVIRMMAESEADPYMLAGVMIEGAVHTLTSRVPAEVQSEAAAALVRLLAERLRENGVEPD